MSRGVGLSKAGKVLGSKQLLKKVVKTFGKDYPHIVEYEFEFLEIIEYLKKIQSPVVELAWLGARASRLTEVIPRGLKWQACLSGVDLLKHVAPLLVLFFG